MIRLSPIIELGTVVLPCFVTSVFCFHCHLRLLFLFSKLGHFKFHDYYFSTMFDDSMKSHCFGKTCMLNRISKSAVMTDVNIC